MRTPPIDAPTNIQLQMNDLITEVRTYRVITPLFGGGVEPGKADPITTIRASEIRGHLRFWWRATRGGQFSGDLLKMREAEEALWGGPTREEKGKTVGGQSLVQISVEVINKGWPTIPEHSDKTKQLYYKKKEEEYFLIGDKFNDRDLATYINGCSYYKTFNTKKQKEEYRKLYVGSPESIDGYLAFPIRPEKKNAGGITYEGVQFQLKIAYNSNESEQAKQVLHLFPLLDKTDKYFTDEIQAALWAWETFGGIGARTRRGFGAISLISHQINGQTKELDKPPHSKKDAESWVKSHLQSIIEGNKKVDNVPSLNQNLAFKVTHPFPNGKSAWRNLGKNLKDFRQKRQIAHDGSSYGRSKWPEPDVIRKLAGTNYEDPSKPEHNHAKPIYEPLIESFPRAAFGVPISFAFQEAQIWNNPRDHTKGLLEKHDPLGTNTLTGVDTDRLASPLIFRPIECSNGSFVGLALILEGTHLPPLQLTTEPHKVHKNLKVGLSKVEANDIGHKASIPKLRSATTDITPRDILLAFLDTL